MLKLEMTFTKAGKHWTWSTNGGVCTANCYWKDWRAVKEWCVGFSPEILGCSVMPRLFYKPYILWQAIHTHMISYVLYILWDYYDSNLLQCNTAQWTDLWNIWLRGEVIDAALRFHHSPTPIQVVRLSSVLDRMHQWHQWEFVPFCDAKIKMKSEQAESKDIQSVLEISWSLS